MPNLFKFKDFREYLKEYYQEQKTLKKDFSYRWFSQRAGINASAFLYYVINGKRNLTKSSVNKISRVIGHNQAESEYFEALVFFNQAQTIPEKSLYYSRLLQIRKPRNISNIQKDRYEYYRTWYHSVLREIVTMFDFKGNFDVLGQMLIPSITPSQAKASVKLLEKLKFIKKSRDGTYKQTDPVISAKTKDPVQVFVLEQFQMEMLSLARKSYDNFPRSLRFSSSTTFSISAETYELFKSRTREYRRELMELAKLDKSMDRTYQLTINLFPVSKAGEELI